MDEVVYDLHGPPVSPSRPLGVIGGHRGLDVMRFRDAGGGYWIRKRAKHEASNQGANFGVDLYDGNLTAIANEANALRLMEGTGYTPMVREHGDDYIDQDDVGVSEVPQDMERWRRNLVWMLATIRSRGLRHGDLRYPNIITRHDHPFVVDWQEAHPIGERGPQKHPWSDSYLLMQNIEGTVGPDGQQDTPRVARRWRAVLGSLGATGSVGLPLEGKTFADYGCFQGDFVALAASEGMIAWGIDSGGFRSGENSVAIGHELWGGFGGFPFGSVRLLQSDIVSYRVRTPFDVAMMFSTWGYIVRDYGHDRAVQVLARIIHDTPILFFETQKWGDGPGPDFLHTDGDVAALLRGVGAGRVEKLATFPVTGRPASRTVWRVDRE